MRTRLLFTATLVIASLAVSAASAVDFYYKVGLDLGQYPIQSTMVAINESGAMTGQFMTNSEATAVLYDGTVHHLGAFDNRPYSQGNALNASEQVAGTSGTNQNDGEGLAIHAFLYEGTLHDLGTFGGTSSAAWGINDSGIVVGQANLSDFSIHAFRYDGSLHDLGTLGGRNSFAYGINNNGQIVGTAYLAGNQQSHAFMYDGTMHDIGTLVSTAHDSKAVAINSAGVVVGNFGPQIVDGILVDTSPSHAFVYDGTVHDLGTLGGNQSWASGINSLGQVVGSSEVADTLAHHAFLYDQAGGMVDLNSLVQPGSGWVFNNAYAINTAHEILVTGSRGSALLVPVIPGDVNGDNVVNGLDIAAVASNWLATPDMQQDPLTGDANFDGIVNGLDIALIASRWLQAITPPGAATAVPEPAPLTLAFLGLALSFAYRLCLLNQCHGRAGRVKRA